MKTELQHLLLGAFLHDIGKVMQRAEIPVSDQTKNFMAQAGPLFQGKSSHYHVQWTSEFFENNKTKLFLDPIASFDDNASQIAFKHHNPTTPIQQIAAESDRLASGMDRSESNHERGVHKKKRMASLLSLMTFDEKPQGLIPKIPLQPLTSVDDSIYPKDYDEEASLAPQYRLLWDQFMDDWQKNPHTSFEATLSYLNSLFEKYFWCVPANTTERIPDSSLYEHSKIAAAIAGALYLYHAKTDSMTLEAVKNRDLPKFILLVGDLSGIQKFIFQISHLGGGKVAKRLRARSFLLEMIVQILSRKIASQIGLPFFNIIMNAGGKFYLLLPNLPESINVIDEVSRCAQDWLQNNFYGDISLNIAHIPLCGLDFTDKRIGPKFEELSDQLVLKKYSQLKNYLSDGRQWFEEKFIVSEALITQEKATGVYEIPSPIQDEDLGTDLSRSKSLAIYPDSRGTYPVLDWSFSLFPSASKYQPDAHCLLSFKRGETDSYPDKRVPVHYEYKALHVPTYKPSLFPEIDAYQEQISDEPLHRGQVLPFTSIAQRSRGPKYLAYLKADIDNLGYILANGLQWSETGWTLSKKATFSRFLELFFSGRIRNMLDDSSNDNPDYKLIYTIFSGGDDLFLVGPWDVMHDFAHRLNLEWKRFTGGGKYMTLSLGLTANRPLSPLWSSAEQAESALHKAKNSVLLEGAKPKNQLCSFNHLVKWDEIDAIRSDIEAIDRWIAQNQLSTAFVRNLLHYSHLASLYRNEGVMEGLRYLPLLSYNTSRNLTKPEHEPIRQWLEELKNPDGDRMRHLGYIAHYSLLLNRSR